MISFFRTSFPVVEHPFLFFVYFGSDFVPGRPGTGVCPGLYTPALVLEQRDNGKRNYFCPGLKGQRDILSRPIVPGSPVACLVPWKPYRKPSQNDAA